MGGNVSGGAETSNQGAGAGLVGGLCGIDFGEMTAEREGRVDDAGMLNIQINEVRMRKAGTPTAGVVSLVKE